MAFIGLSVVSHHLLMIIDLLIKDKLYRTGLVPAVVVVTAQKIIFKFVVEFLSNTNAKTNLCSSTINDILF